MRLVAAFLAKDVDKGANGLFHIFGGGYEVIGVEVLPTNPTLTLFTRIELSPEELDGDRSFSVDITDPDGIRRPLQHHGKLPLAKNERAGMPAHCNVILKLGLIVTQIGVHVIHVLADDVELGKISLYVNLEARTLGSADRDV